MRSHEDGGSQPPPTNSVSISFRLQRVTVEDAYVSVLVTPDLVTEQADGSGRLDVPALVARAVEMGTAPTTTWSREEQSVAPHPLQQPPPGSGAP